MRYHVVIVDERGVASEQPESALFENDSLSLCEDVLSEYLSDTSGIIKAFIEDTKTKTVVYSWSK